MLTCTMYIVHTVFSCSMRWVSHYLILSIKRLPTIVVKIIFTPLGIRPQEA